MNQCTGTVVPGVYSSKEAHTCFWLLMHICVHCSKTASVLGRHKSEMPFFRSAS